MSHPPRFDFDERPLVVIWEMTQACDLVCLHCRAEAQPARHPGELDTAEARGLIDQVAELAPGVCVLSGGDPMKRDDVYHLIRYGVASGVRMAMTPSVTPLLTDRAIEDLAAAGLSRLAVSLDGSCRQVHDTFRGVAGSFERTLDVIERACDARLPVQINTTVSRHNLDEFELIAERVRDMRLVLWSIFFLVPVGRALPHQRIEPEQYERVFDVMWRLSKQVPFAIKSTEAPHYRRFVLQRLKEERATPDQRRRAMAATMGVNDAKGFVFVSHTGEVFPSGFLPVSVGNVRQQHLADLYRGAPLFRQLRAPESFDGKCGFCEFRNLCGGSRARAWALSGNPLASDPDCLYVPAGESCVAATSF